MATNGAMQLGNTTTIKNPQLQEALRMVARLNLPIRDANGKVIVGDPKDSFFDWKKGIENWKGYQAYNGWKAGIEAHNIVEKALASGVLAAEQIVQYVSDYTKGMKTMKDKVAKAFEAGTLTNATILGGMELANGRSEAYATGAFDMANKINDVWTLGTVTLRGYLIPYTNKPDSEPLMK